MQQDFLPLILVTIGISGQIQNNLALLAVNCIAALSAFVGPLLLPKLGHKGLSKYGFLLVTIGISISAWGVYSSSVAFIIFGAALMLCGLLAEGETTLHDPNGQIARGYEDLPGMLRALGAEVEEE